MAGQNKFEILLLNYLCWYDTGTLRNKNENVSFWEIALLHLDFEETETHVWKSLLMAHSKQLEIANLALLIPCMEFEHFCVQILSNEVL